MPVITLNAKRLTANADKLFLVASLLFLVTTLSGCSAIGFQKFAALQVTSTPEASVLLDGRLLGKTPFYSDQLKSGSYTLKITTSDATYLAKIELSDGTLTVVNRGLSTNFLAQAGENLSLAPSLKGIMITSLPPDADITIDGRYIGKTPAQITNIATGEHKVLVTKQAYVNREFAIKTLSKYQVIAEVTLASKVAKGLATEIAQVEASSSAKVEIAKTFQNFVNVKKEPDAAASDIGRARTGQQLDFKGENPNWLQVIFEGKLGWIPKEFAKKL